MSSARRKDIGCSLNVLLVEDSESSRRIFEAILKNAGLAVTTAKSGFEAMQCLVQGKFDLLITNNYLSDINGPKLVRYVRDNPVHKSHKEIPIIIRCGDGMLTAQEREREIKRGVSAYLIHPSSPRKLVSLVRQLLKLDSNETPI